jgi:nicotinamide-nucleotide amidase
VYQFESEPAVQTQVADALTTAGESVAVAESITGGLVGALVTEVPGSGGFFDRSLVTYTYEAKRDELGVQRSVLQDIGAVNETVAEQMARGARNAAGTAWGLATTGLAGPPDEKHDQPVGTVYIGVVRGPTGGHGKSTVQVSEYAFDGSRSEIKERAARQALQNLLEAVSADSPAPERGE